MSVFVYRSLHWSIHCSVLRSIFSIFIYALHRAILQNFVGDHFWPIICRFWPWTMHGMQILNFDDII